MNFNKTHKDIILIVDDISTNVEVLFDVLEDSGFKVLVAENGESAVEMAEYVKPSIITSKPFCPSPTHQMTY